MVPSLPGLLPFYLTLKLDYPVLSFHVDVYLLTLVSVEQGGGGEGAI